MTRVELPPEVQRVAQLLSQGLDDRAAARAEGIDVRTVRRRVALLQQELGSRTRFQAGYRLAVRTYGPTAVDQVVMLMARGRRRRR